MSEAELSLLFLRPLNRLGIRYIVGGGVAAILYGEPRFTNDLDLVVFLRSTYHRHESIKRTCSSGSNDVTWARSGSEFNHDHLPHWQRP